MKKQIHIDWYSFFGFILFGFFSLFLWRFETGYYILYPFTILGTWFHEMGHGVMAMCMGGTFELLEIFPNGSGLAHSSVREYFIHEQYAKALISGAGLMGPPIMGSILILMSKSVKKSTFILYALSIAMIISVIIWVRTPVGISIVSIMGVLLLIIAIKGGDFFKQLTVQIVGLQACVSTYRQLDYLFMTEVTVDGQPGLSDSGNIAANLGMSVPFWGTCIAVISFLLLISSLYIRNRTKTIVD